jgi:hypothetical protein
MFVSVEWRRGLDLSGDFVGRAVLVVVPVNMHDATMTVRVRMAGEDGDAAQRGIERIVVRVVVVIVGVLMIAAVIVFHKAGLVGVLVLAVSEGNGDFEAMRFGYLVKRFPVVCPVGKGEYLTRVVLPEGLHTHPINGRSGKAETGRNTILENRQLGHAVPGVDALQLRPVDIAGGGRVVVAVVVVVVAAAEQIP